MLTISYITEYRHVNERDEKAVFLGNTPTNANKKRPIASLK